MHIISIELGSAYRLCHKYHGLQHLCLPLNQPFYAWAFVQWTIKGNKSLHLVRFLSEDCVKLIGVEDVRATKTVIILALQGLTSQCQIQIFGTLLNLYKDYIPGIQIPHAESFHSSTNMPSVK